MPKFRLRHAFVAVLLLVAMLAQGTWALASTTGGISGTVVDAATGKAVADATVTANSPSGGATVTTDTGGNFHFLTLGPDTYTVSATKSGYNSASQSGITVFADQTHTLTLAITPSLKTIANVTSRVSGNLVKPGTTSDVYSVNATTQQVVSGQGGGFNLNQAYSGIYSQPGVESYIGSAGWGQVFYIRGAGYGQTGYEFDGVPVNRAFDNYNGNSLSSLGQQELQVYTGGSPASASSATLGGFINQVIKTGTYPGTGTLKGGIGAPGFYHALTAEAGGSNPNRTFSYYVGLQGYNQHFPAGTWANMSNIPVNGLSSYGLLNGSGEIATATDALCSPVYGDTPINGACPDAGAYAGAFLNGPFQPCQTSGTNAGEPIGYTAAAPGPFNGACFGYFPWNTYLSDMYERDSVVNLHFALPHKFDSGRDDVQLLFDNAMQYQLNGDSLLDAGGLSFLDNLLAPYRGFSTPGSNSPGLCGYYNNDDVGCAGVNSPMPYLDSKIFAPGTNFGQPVSTATLVPYWYPNSPTNRVTNTPIFGAPKAIGIPAGEKDGFWTDVGIAKAQYTKNIGSNAYARLYGYTMYSNWLIGAEPAGSTCYLVGLLCSAGGPGWDGTANYELATHTRGAEFQFADQLNAQNLLRLTANYTTAGVTRWNNTGFFAGYAGSRFVTNLTNGDPNNPMCYDWRPTVGGAPNANQGNPISCFYSGSYGTVNSLTHGQAENPCGTAGGPPPGSPACVANANWQVTVPGGQGYWNTVRPVFSTLSLEDELKPNDKLDLNLSVRYESYQYNLVNMDNAEGNFWFNAAAETVCYDPATGQPQTTPLAQGQPIPPNVIQTRTPFASCGTAPSGQRGLHPIGPNLAATPLGAACVSAGNCSATQWYHVKGSATSFTKPQFSPRLGGTYTLSADDVLRFTLGKYTQPTETAFEQYNDQSKKRAAVQDFSRFWGLGFNTPSRDNPVQYTYNYDFSWEHRFHSSDFTMKLSPFYRDTYNELVTIPLGPGFVSGVNLGHQHSYGVEFQLQKGDPTRDGWSGALSYTYTKALIQYGNAPNGTNYIDTLNAYVGAFNALTSAGGGSPCYNGGVGQACPATFTGANSTVVINPYYNVASQPTLARKGWYVTYPNEPPLDPNLNGGGTSAIWPHQINAWAQYRHGRWAVAPNITLQSGAYYGSPVDIYGIDPRACAQNQTAATTPSGAAVPGITSATAGFCDFLTANNTNFTKSGYLAIPNPYTGTFDSEGKFQQPWQLNVGALLKYDISPKVTANLTLTNLFNWCYGGSNTPWSTAFKPNQWVCGYYGNNGNYVGPLSGQPGYGGGFFYGTSPGSVSNGTPTYAQAFNYPYAPFSSALPFQAYLELQIKL